MSIRIRTYDGHRQSLEPRPDETLARTIFLSGLWHGMPLCSGLGKCGLCRVRFLSEAPKAVPDEHRKLGEDVTRGWRLACLHPSAPCEIELPEPRRAGKAMQTLAAATGDFTLAVDLGTTSVHWTALTDEVPAVTGSELNPQTGLGSEVMSRLAVAGTPQGRHLLRSLILDRLADIVSRNERALRGKCTGMAVSGNPAMTYILLDREPDDLAAAPYALSYVGGAEHDLGQGLPPAYIPPLLAPFVGADLSAGLVDVEYRGAARCPLLLADLGTNGEFILSVSPEKRFCASVPMGPALEGMGLSFGRTAGPGAITGFTLTPAGLQATYFDTPQDETGMTGTGYLSLAAILLKLGVLTDSGQFGKGTTPLASRLARKVATVNGEPAFAITDDLYLPASDVEEILKVKAAFNLAMSALLNEAGLDAAGVAAIHIAGALGEHVSLDDLETLGFLPAGCAAKAIKAGNTSLKGTEALLTDPGARPFAESVPLTLTRLELAGDHSFGTEYVRRMRFTHVH